EIPVRGFIGHLEEGGFLPHNHKVFLWAHLNFNIEYNGNQVIYANVTTKEQAPVSLDGVTAPYEVVFTYSVKWMKTNMAYDDRAKRVRDNSFFPKTLEIHWLSIINSMVLVFLLIGFVVIILTRVLKSDFARYNVDEEESDDIDQEDNGWKIIHSDVFRFPSFKSLFTAILGVGSQFLALATGIMVMAVLGMFNVHHHGSINSAGVILYAFTSGIAGYVAANMYKVLGGDNWVWNLNLTSCLFAAPFFMVWAFVNSVAWGYGTTQALPWQTVVLLMCLWVFDILNGRRDVLFIVTYILNGKRDVLFIVTYILNGRRDVLFIVTYILNGRRDVLFIVTYILNGKRDVLFIVTNILNGRRDVLFIVTYILNGRRDVLFIVTYISMEKDVLFIVNIHSNGRRDVCFLL
ncbi:transmembrane 9 superfamily member 1, partial [Mytilus galloprovincialis]